MYCTNCGTKLKEGAKFCTECGTPVKVLNFNAATAVDLVPSETSAAQGDENIVETLQSGQRRSRAKLSPLILIALVIALTAGTAFAAYYVYTEVYLPYKAAQENVRQEDENISLSQLEAGEQQVGNNEIRLSSEPSSASSALAEANTTSEIEGSSSIINSSSLDEVQEEVQNEEEIEESGSEHVIAGPFEFNLPNYWADRVSVDVVSDTEVIVRPKNAGKRGYNYLARIVITDDKNEATTNFSTAQSLHKSGKLDDGSFLAVSCVTPQLWYPAGEDVPGYIYGDLTREQFTDILDLATGGLYDVDAFSDVSIEQLYPAQIMEEFAESVTVSGHTLVERFY